MSAALDALAAAGKASAVAVRAAAPGEAWPAEGVEGETASVIADAVVSVSAAVVLFGPDARLRPILGAAHLIAHAREDAIVPEFGDALGRFDGAGRMISICGPSRTADIEKKLVIGVHGPRSITIVIHGAATGTRSD